MRSLNPLVIALAACALASPALVAQHKFSALVNEVAREFDMSSDLLHAVIAVESAYDARAVSPKGAQGLMQLMPATAQRFGVADPFDPLENVNCSDRSVSNSKPSTARPEPKWCSPDSRPRRPGTAPTHLRDARKYQEPTRVTK